MAPKVRTLPQLRQTLTERLANANSVAVLGVGSELRGDDAVGMRVAELLRTQELAHPRLVSHAGSTAPESATGPIRSQKPSHLIIVDAAALRTSPGEVALLEREDIDGITFCTHALPLSVVIDFLRYDNSDLDAFALAIQAEHLFFGEPLSVRVEQTARAVAQLLVDCLPP